MQNTSDFFPVDFTDPAASFEAHLLVVDPSGAPIADASININGVAYDVATDGTVALEGINVQVAPQVVISAPGFMPMHATLSYANAGQQEMRVVLTPATVSTFRSELGTTAGVGGTSVTFAGGAILGPDGAPYAGDVTLAIASMDPVGELFASVTDSNALEFADVFDVDRIPQGAVFAQLADGSVRTAPPEAVMQVELTTPTGEPLHLNPNVGATVALPLPDISLKQLGDTVPLMSLDAAQGMWVSNGDCTVVESPIGDGSLACVGSVRHFSPVAVSAQPAFAPGCIDYRVSITGLPTSNVSLSQTVEESVLAPDAAGFRPITSREATLYRDGMCFISQLRWSRVVVRATTSSGVRFFASPWEIVTPTPLSASQMNTLRTSPSGACAATCAAKPITFNFAEGAVGDDADGDGYQTGAGVPMARRDCDDTDRNVHPNASEAVCATKDYNCDGRMPSQTGPRWDGAGMTPSLWNNTYCKSTTACAMTVSEVPRNAFDENCDGIVSDQDGDGFFAANDPAYAAAVVDNPSTKSDCNDFNRLATPTGQEVAGNSVDENCDGVVIDADGDGYVAPSQTGRYLTSVLYLRPIADESKRFMDCNDNRADVYPGANTAPERVLQPYFSWIHPVPSQIEQSLGFDERLCAFFTDGVLNAAGRALLVDADCNGVYSDLDGDGYAVAGDNSLGSDKALDCDDSNPNFTTQSANDCQRTGLVSCRIQQITGDSDSDRDGIADFTDKCPGFDDRLDADGDGAPNSCDACPLDAMNDSDHDGICDSADRCAGVADGVDTDGDDVPAGCDGCPNDPNKDVVGACGCGVADTDTDSDGTPNCVDGCPSDMSKVAAGACGCGTAETDTDSDGTPDCTDLCDSDPNKTIAGMCGCGAAETNSDSDPYADCVDGCPTDSNKMSAGVCGCGVADTDTDYDTTLDCNDLCPTDMNKTEPGDCGCGFLDVPGCGVVDMCPSDPSKTEPGVCGCGVVEDVGDADFDTTPNCLDLCPEDAHKTAPGTCGCGVDDSVPMCGMVVDMCPSDPSKTEPGMCGCGEIENTGDMDHDSVINCLDDCPYDASGSVLATYYFDYDSDTWGDSGMSMMACSAPSGYATRGGDCVDYLSDVHPGLEEICGDSLNNDCSGDTDGTDCVTAPPVSCTARTDSGTSKRYFFCTNARDWTAVSCPSGMAITVPSSSTENDWLRSTASDLGWSGKFWIGLRSPGSSGTWTPTISGSSYYNWGSGQPSLMMYEECAAMSVSDGKWSDEMCYWFATNLNYVCEPTS